MKRLIDEAVPLDSKEQRLAELFAAVPRSTPDPFRKRRIRARLRDGASGHSARVRLVELRWAFIIGSLIFATTAAAMVTRQMGFWGKSTSAPQVDTGSSAAKVMPTDAPRAVEKAAIAAPEPSELPTPRAESKPIGSHSPTTPSEDPTLVAAAIDALRNRHNPAKARSLLNQYLRENPRGALAEEALALSIEAADAMKDPQSSSLGCRYIALYPNGRHRSLATRACGRSAVDAHSP